jgi:hypothetical protein
MTISVPQFGSDHQQNATPSATTIHSDKSMLFPLAALAHYHCGTAAAFLAKVVYGGHRFAASRVQPPPPDKRPLLLVVFEEDNDQNDNGSNATIDP